MCTVRLHYYIEDLRNNLQHVHLRPFPLGVGVMLDGGGLTQGQEGMVTYLKS